MVSTRKTRRCPTGQIRRKSYIRRGTRVASRCIKDVGNPGKGFGGPGKGIGSLRQGELAQFGYDHVVSVPVGKRHLALARAVKAFGALSVWRKLNAVYVYTRNTAPASSAIFKADRDWIKESYGLHA